MHIEEAVKLLNTHVKNENLRRHCMAVSFSLAGIYDYLSQQKQLDINAPEKETWEVLGIIHDSDYEYTKEDWSKHTLMTLEWLKAHGIDENDVLYQALMSHNSKHTGFAEPNTQMEWALECCDELTGFVVACTLVLPSKKVADLKLESIQSKWRQPAFARNVDRSQIEQCEKRLGIPLPVFQSIVLQAMQAHASELGL